MTLQKIFTLLLLFILGLRLKGDRIIKLVKIFIFFVTTDRPSLLSLDLSYNNLTDLKTTVEILKHLPALRNLLLVGNPLHVS